MFRKIVLIAFLFFPLQSKGGEVAVQSSHHAKVPEAGKTTEANKETEAHSSSSETFLTIYKDAALVRKVSPLPLKAGTHFYKLKGLASTLCPSSLKLDLRSALKMARIEEYSLKSLEHEGQSKDQTEKELEISIDAKQTDPHNHLDLLYFFKELGWKVEYTLQLASTYDALELNSWIEISNQSSIDFHNTTISLIDSPAPYLTLEDSYSAEGALVPNPTVYKVPHPINLPKRSVKRVNWINSSVISVQQQYRLYVGGKYLGDLNGKAAKPLVEVWVNFLNDPQQGLGVPLPLGQAIIYYQRSKDNPEILGFIEIPYTPVNQNVSLKLPVAANNKQVSEEGVGLNKISSIETELEQTEFKKLTDKITEANYRLCLKNKGHQATTIKIILDLPSGSCKIVKENKPHRIDSPKQFSWNIEIPAQSEVDLKYRLQIDQT